MAHRKVGIPPDEVLEYLIRWENCSNLQVTWEPTRSLLFAPKKLKLYHKKEREIRLAAAAEHSRELSTFTTPGRTDVAALMLSDLNRLGRKR